MEPFSALLALCAGNSLAPVNSPHKGQWREALMFSLISHYKDKIASRPPYLYNINPLIFILKRGLVLGSDGITFNAPWRVTIGSGNRPWIIDRIPNVAFIFAHDDWPHYPLLSSKAFVNHTPCDRWRASCNWMIVPTADNVMMTEIVLSLNSRQWKILWSSTRK